jgi:hypothetical protein
VDEDARKQVIDKLHELKGQVGERLGGDPEHHDPVVAQIDEVRSLVEEGPTDPKNAQIAAGGLERRLLAWEAEHPQLTALASTIVRALEDAGL